MTHNRVLFGNRSKSLIPFNVTIKKKRHRQYHLLNTEDNMLQLYQWLSLKAQETTPLAAG
jgi:hypothetical protein